MCNVVCSSFSSYPSVSAPSYAAPSSIEPYTPYKVLSSPSSTHSGWSCPIWFVLVICSCLVLSVSYHAAPSIWPSKTPWASISDYYNTLTIKSLSWDSAAFWSLRFGALPPTWKIHVWFYLHGICWFVRLFGVCFRHGLFPVLYGFVSFDQQYVISLCPCFVWSYPLLRYSSTVHDCSSSFLASVVIERFNYGQYLSTSAAFRTLVC